MVHELKIVVVLQDIHTINDNDDHQYDSNDNTRDACRFCRLSVIYGTLVVTLLGSFG